VNPRKKEPCRRTTNQKKNPNPYTPAPHPPPKTPPPPTPTHTPPPPTPPPPPPPQRRVMVAQGKTRGKSVARGEEGEELAQDEESDSFTGVYEKKRRGRIRKKKKRKVR